MAAETLHFLRQVNAFELIKKANDEEQGLNTPRLWTIYQRNVAQNLSIFYLSLSIKR